MWSSASSWRPTAICWKPRLLVEDPDTFNEPLHMAQRWRKVKNPMLETVCAENNVDYFHQNLFPLPEATTPDF